MVIVAFGDSNTQGAFLQPGESWPAILQHSIDIPVHNAGVGGNTTQHALNRLQRDVLQYIKGKGSNQTDLVILGFGMNDHVYTEAGVQKVNPSEFEENMVKHITEISACGAKVALCLLHHVVSEYYYSRHPQVWYPSGVAGEIDGYNNILRKVAADLDITVIDIPLAFKSHDPLYATEQSRLLRTITNADAADGVHLTAEGARTYAAAVQSGILQLIRKTNLNSGQCS